MKKEQIVAWLLSAIFAYSFIRWSISIYNIVSEDHHVGWEFFIHFGALLVGIAAMIQYFVSDYKRSQFLRAYLVFMVVNISLSIILSSLSLLITIEGADRNSTLISLAIQLAEIVLSCLLLSALKDHRTPQLSITNNESGESVSHYIPAPLLKRFFNRVLDIALLGYAVYSHYSWWHYVIEPKLYEIPLGMFLSHVAFLIVLEYFLLITYYSVLEYAFRTSFGKIITGTTIVHVAGGYPGLGNIIGRTFCRFLPADAISFFFFDDNRGWHDRLSGTGVVEERYQYQSDIIE